MATVITSNKVAMLLIDHQVGTIAFSLTDIDAVNLKHNTLWLSIKPLHFRKLSTNKREDNLYDKP